MRALCPPALLLVVTALVLASTGCGGDGGESSSGARPDTWAATVCGTLGEWVDTLQADSRELGAALQNTKDLKSVKAKFVTFIEDAEKSSETMVERMKDVDEPAVEKGDAVKRELIAALEQIRASFSQAIDGAKKLSTNDLQSFSAGVGTLSAEVQRNLEAGGDEFKKLTNETQELKEAIDGEPACQRFRT